jgi:outer membrane lipoprotein-sorting protein
MTMPFTKLRTLAPLAALALGAAAVPLAPALSAPPAQQSAQVDQAITALRAISTMRADFLQTDRNGQRITGVMTLQRPGKIRFQYQKGVPLLIVSDGAALTMIDYEVRQVQRWPIRNSPLGALLDPNKDVAKFARPIATGNPAVLSMEIKDPRHPEYGTITMIMVKNAAAPGGFALDSWVSFDAQAKRTSVRLTNQQYGIAVPANMFRWNDPRLPTRR